MSNSLFPDQSGHFVGPDLDPKCLEKLPADNFCCHEWRKNNKKKRMRENYP